ncbi:MAG TPA: choice-of-anchor D domain-containing protein [Roseiarcus sp.]|nr:choice-of-anchor D domain-containing protein [Roseiarcus sp.]
MSLTGTVWAPIGPSPIDQGAIDANGQVTAVAFNPSNPNIIYIGTAWGGVWLSRDGGATWAPIFDRAPSLGVGDPGALAIDPVNANVVYVGTSSREGSQWSSEYTQPSAGLFKSTDSGASWIQLGSGYPPGPASNASILFSQLINAVIVDPDNTQTLYLASSAGLFVSKDGGFNWTQGVAPAGNARTLALDTTSPAGARILYAGVTGVGVVQSSDGGLNWTTILNAATPAVAAALTGGGFSKVIVALAPAASPPSPAGIQVIYVSMVGTGSAPSTVGLFQSINQGQTWHAQAATGLAGLIDNPYGGYSFVMAVDPQSPGDGVGDIIYFGAEHQARSTDAGASFAGLSGLHADTHTWAFSPQPGPFSVVYCGNDGGLFKCTGGTAFTSLNAGGIQTALFYNIDVKKDALASVTLGALQDNGIVTTAGAAPPTWIMGAGGDGFAVAHDWVNATDVYGRFNATIVGSTTDGDAYGVITPPFSAAESGVYLAAVATDPNAAGGVYASSNQNLWRSTTGGAAWPNKAPIPGTAQDVNVAPANSNNLVVSVGGRVLVSTDALGAFTLKDITRNLPGRFVARVKFDPNDPATIYAVLGGFNGSPGGHVYRTTLTATAWTDISPPLDLPFNALALDGSELPTTLYAGTDFGVLRSVDGGVNWSVLDDIHFPGAPVFDLAFHNGELRAGTFGRGLFSFVKPTGPAIAVGPEDGLAFGTVCAGSVEYLTIEVSNVGVADLLIVSVERLMGSSGFTVLPNPATPLILAPGDNIDFTVAFLPTGVATLEVATIRIITNDPTAPVVDLTATGVLGASRVVTAIANAGSFGNVCLGAFADELLTINNSGTCPLWIFDISGSADFLAPSVLSYPVRVGSGDSIDVVIRFQPTAPDGPKAGAITILSNDPASPHAVAVSGVLAAPKANLIIANAGGFGDVCVGSFADEPLIVTNSGKCTLNITGISSSSADFLAPQVSSFPITVGPGDALPLPIRFKPLSFGPKTGTITVTSNDPASPISVNVSGDAPSGRLTVAGSTTFGGVNAGCCADRTVWVSNTGACALDVTAVHFKRRSQRWRLLNNPFPARLRPGAGLPVVIQYHADERCPRPCELVIESDDPATPVKFVEVLAYTVWDCGCKDGCEERGKDDGDDGCKPCCDRRPCCRQGYPCCDDDDDPDDDRG